MTDSSNKLFQNLISFYRQLIDKTLFDIGIDKCINYRGRTLSRVLVSRWGRAYRSNLVITHFKWFLLPELFNVIFFCFCFLEVFFNGAPSCACQLAVCLSYQFCFVCDSFICASETGKELCWEVLVVTRNYHFVLLDVVLLIKSRILEVLFVFGFDKMTELNGYLSKWKWFKF